MKKRIEDRLILAQADAPALIIAFESEPDAKMRWFISGCFCYCIMQLTQNAPGSLKQILDALNPPPKLRAAAEGAMMTSRIC